MIQYDLDVFIGTDKNEPGPNIKHHDTGVTFVLHLAVKKKVSIWRNEVDPYTAPGEVLGIMKIKKPDGTRTETDAKIVRGSIAICPLPPEACTATGTCICELAIYDKKTGKRLTTTSFCYDVVPEAVCDDDVQSKDYIDILGEEIKELSELKDIAQSLRDDAGAGKFNGEKGDTPIKGTDYWTKEDQAEIVRDVIAALPLSEGVGF